MTSPYVEAAAQRAAYLPTINVCPCCGYTPMLDFDGKGGMVIWCDHDECESRDMQANGRTLKEVSEAWNMLPSLVTEETPDPQGDAMDRARDEYEREQENGSYAK